MIQHPYKGMMLEAVTKLGQTTVWHWQNPHTRKTLCGKRNVGTHKLYTGNPLRQKCRYCERLTTHESKN